jgi:two-component system sensor histidine kinase AgrC
MILYFLFKLASLVVLMTCLTQLKYSIKKSYAIIAAVNIVIWLVNYTIYTYKGTIFLARIFPLTISAPAFICFLFLSKSKGFKFLFSFLTIFNFGMLKSYIGSLSFMFFNNLNIRIFFESLSLIIILFLILKVFRRPYFKIQETIDKGWGVFCSVPCLLSIIVGILVYYPSSFKEKPIYIFIVLLVFTLLFVFYAIIYLNFENISLYYQLQQDREIMLIQTHMQKKEYMTITDKINAIQIYRHDMRHNINIINSFLNDNNICEAKKYLDNLTDNLNKNIIEKYCDNYVVNVFLSSYINKAKNENIQVIIKVHIPENINIDNMELGLIFANTIENAIIACKKIENFEERQISIVCKEHYNQLYIQICNSYVGEVLFDKDVPISNVKDHGFGTRSIATIVDKYDGICSFTAKDNTFKATAILKY